MKGELCEVESDIVETALAAKNFSTLATALGAAGLIETLKGDGPFTVFAPTDSAFAKVPRQTLDDLLQPENKEKLAAILNYHVVPGRVTSREVFSMNSATTLQGQKLKISKKDDVKVNEAKVDRHRRRSNQRRDSRYRQRVDARYERNCMIRTRGFFECGDPLAPHSKGTHPADSSTAWSSQLSNHAPDSHECISFHGPKRAQRPQIPAASGQLEPRLPQALMVSSVQICAP